MNSIHQVVVKIIFTKKITVHQTVIIASWNYKFFKLKNKQTKYSHHSTQKLEKIAIRNGFTVLAVVARLPQRQDWSLKFFLHYSAEFKNKNPKTSDFSL